MTGMAGSNLAEDMDVRLLCVLYVVYVPAFATSWSFVQSSPTVCVI